MKHADCGGELKRTASPDGKYRCAKCRRIVIVGRVERKPLYFSKIRG